MKYKLTLFSEIDKYAEQSYCAVHNESESKNIGDITKVDAKDVPDFNTMFGGSPCQDFSVAGKREGAVWTCKSCGHKYNPLEAHYTVRDKCPECGSAEIEKTRSSLIVEWLRFLREKKPRFAMYENVKNLTGEQFRPIFELFLKEIDEYGYNVYWKVLNAKDYGVPQNRERVYCVIIRKDLDNGSFEFPDPIPLSCTLQDMLEEEVDEKYYLPDEKVKSMIEMPPRRSAEQSERKDEKVLTDTSGISLNGKSVMIDCRYMGHDGKARLYEDSSPCLSARDYKDPIRVLETGNGK